MADNKEKLYCPACGKEMSKVYDKKAKICVDICLNGCGGIFFDNRELEKFDFPDENADTILDAIKGKTFETVDDSEERKCPCCETTMMKMGAAGGSVEIDVCSVCGGKFLDNNELQKIRQYNEEYGAAKTNVLIDNIYATAIEVTAETLKLSEKAKPSMRRQFFEDLVKRFI